MLDNVNATDQDECKLNAKSFAEFTKKKEGRYELIDGKAYLMSSPSVTHQRIAAHMYDELKICFNNRKCEVFIPPLDVFLYDKNMGCSNVFQPDLLVVCDKKKIKEDGIHGAPDIVVEVVSKSSRKNDYIRKLGSYMLKGVKEYWILDYENEQAIVYSNIKNELSMVAYSLNGTAKSRVFDGLCVDFSMLFANQDEIR